MFTIVIRSVHSCYIERRQTSEVIATATSSNLSHLRQATIEGRNNLRLDYKDRICRLNTRKGSSIWMDDCPANEWTKHPHSERTPIATRNDKACTIEQGSKHKGTYVERGYRMVI